jgi:hydrogenase maturation protein HypF
MRERLRVAIRGAVQGVGFRPFVHRLARELSLDGWVMNSPQGVFLELEGNRGLLERALAGLRTNPPPRAVVQSVEATWLDPVPHAGFQIRESRGDGTASTLVMPDLAVCPECLSDIADPDNRRYRYPFTNCTNCGPRFSIIRRLPYDRANTSMRDFTMCPACRREYEDPADRRFHAQPIACPVCGPQLALWSRTGETIAAKDEALAAAAVAVRRGLIVALKGLGGFQLIVDAANEPAVAALRERKHREEKPFALMYPRLDEVELACEVSDGEARLLLSPEAPILLLKRRFQIADRIADGVAPSNPYLAVMLPYTPLHHLLMTAIDRPVVATSGNIAEEPMCIDEADAISRLGGIADLFLVHDRPIVRHVDDSIVRMMAGRELVMRRARGYAPLPVHLGEDAPPIVAVGGHQKNTIAVAVGHNAFISQHIGDLESKASTDAFLEVIESLEGLYRAAPQMVAADLHPDYVSTKYAYSLGLPVVQVQHHFAHVTSCMTENDLDGPVLGVSWDGTGYGLDGTVWGGEFLLATSTNSFTRVACLRPFRLPGAERAVREPRRSALGVLYAMKGDAAADSELIARAFSAVERKLLVQLLARGEMAPITTSAGRLFDAVAALTGLKQKAGFEGQAAMLLEHAIDDTEKDSYPFAISYDTAKFAPRSPWQLPDYVVDWEPLIAAILHDLAAGTSTGIIAARFHNALADAIVAVAVRVGERQVVLTGGCFQNRALTERAIDRLRAAGFRPYWHQRVPPNDGGLSLGQIAACLDPAVKVRASASAKASADRH